MKQKTTIGGFSVAGLLVAAGMMSGLALVLSQLSKRQMIIQRKAETGVEIAELSQRITRTLQDGNACLNTVRQIPGPLSVGSTYIVNEIWNENGAFLTRGGVYRNRLVGIKNSGGILLTDITIDVDTNIRVGRLNLQVTFLKNSKAITGQKEVIKKFPLAVELDATDNVLSCLSLRGGALDVAKRDICPQMGGVYDATTGTCTNGLIGERCPGSTTATPPTQEYLRGIDNNHDLVCALPPPARLHPTGYNCYLLTTYNFFDPREGTMPFRNNPANPPVVKRWRMRPKTASSGYIGSFRNNTGLDSFDGMDSCEPGYDRKFHRIRGLSVAGGYEARALIFHYCCR